MATFSNLFVTQKRKRFDFSKMSNDVTIAIFGGARNGIAVTVTIF
jgi:hypothetical protein